MVSCCSGGLESKANALLCILVVTPHFYFLLLSVQSKVAVAAGQVPEDQDRLLGEAKRLVDKSAFDMKSSLVSVIIS